MTPDIPASYAYINVDTYVLAGDDDCYGCQPELQILGLGGAASQSNAPNGPYDGIGTEYEDVPNPGELIISSEFSPFDYGGSDTLDFAVLYTDAGNPTPETRSSWELTLAGLLGVLARVRTVYLGKKQKNRVRVES